MTTTRAAAPSDLPTHGAATPGRPDDAEVDVVVVGAGPVGLTLACALLHHGVRVRIFERGPGRSGASKGHNLLPRSQELLETIGVRTAIAARAHSAPHTQVLLDRRPLARLDVRGCGSPYDSVLFSGQDTIEAVLSEAVAERGGRVERARPVRAVAPDEDGVTVAVGRTDVRGEEQDAEDERVRCRYLVGADGVRGSVREAVGLGFSPTALQERATRQIDAKLSWRRPTEPDRSWFFLHPNGFAGILPVWEGLHRLFFVEDEAEVPEREPTLAEMVQRAREVTGDETFEMSDPAWSSWGRFRHGVAPAYARGRVFLAGDAGHRTLPIGGQGMNAGLHDAIGLAWRLAKTLAGQGGPLVLDSYGPERHGAHERLEAQQVRGYRQLVHRPRGVDVVVGAVADLIPNLASRVFGGEDLTQLSVAYPDSDLSADRFPALSALGPARRGAPRAGARAPDAPVTTPAGATTSLLDRIHHPDGVTWGWCLLAFDGREQGSREALVRAVEAVSAWPWVRPHLVLADPLASDDGAGATPCLFDLDGLSHAAYGLEGVPALVLVRPDGHIAFRGPAGHPERLHAHLRSVSGQDATGAGGGGGARGRAVGRERRRDRHPFRRARAAAYGRRS
ncbi:FAD-dependent monooxygenase [Quadrisphaera sp. DSM 44207]|uniref:FAD-dependent monooxygenase n=1 Tax=Quadrisphaera sp. DSM 44207 TaxID=1881057 RepID=UPI00088B3971|nr:FAD-dependent monooxygenase [Quadrisphaera sp. DSM 44207]SDQ42209.1 2-polyprenyl-6-methoxyphenol hydroxylase [Quadrisphaera sp. DSM 44207]